MKGKQLLLLLLLVAVLGAAGYYVQKGTQASWASSGSGAGGKVLEFPVNDVAQVHLKSAGGDVNIVKKNDEWTVQERADFPANYEQVSGLVRKLWDMKTVQEVKVGASQMARLELAEPGQPEGAGTLVEFKDKDGKNVGGVLLGKKSMRKSESPSPMGDAGGFPTGRYVLPIGGKKVSLVSETLDEVEVKPERWLRKDFIKVENPKSIAIAGQTPGMQWKLMRESATADWKFADASPTTPSAAAKAVEVKVGASTPPEPSPKPAETKPADPKPSAPVKGKPTEAKPAEPAPPESKPADPKPCDAAADQTTAAAKPAESKPAEPAPAKPADAPASPAAAPAAPPKPADAPPAAPKPEEAKPTAPTAPELDKSKVSQFGTVLTSPSFKDVLAPDANPEETGLDKPTTVTIETFDNFTYTLQIGKLTNEAYPVRFTVAAELPKERTPGKDEKPEDKTRLDEEFKTTQKRHEEKLASEKKLEGRIYLLEKYSVEPLLKERSALLTETKPEVVPAPSAANTPGIVTPPSAVTPPISVTTPPISVTTPPVTAPPAPKPPAPAPAPAPPLPPSPQPKPPEKAPDDSAPKP